MNDPLAQARRQLKSELRELGFWPNRQQTESLLEDQPRQEIEQHIRASLADLDAAELIVVKRVVDTLSSG